MLSGYERSPAEDIAGEDLLSFSLLTGLLPELRRELEDPAPGPVGKQAQDVAQIGPRLDPHVLAAREERDEGGVPESPVVTAHEHPVLPSDSLSSQLPLASIVVQPQARVVEETAERLALVALVRDRLADGALREHFERGGIRPLEEPLEHGARPLATLPRPVLPLLALHLAHLPIDPVELSDEAQRHQRSLLVRRQGIEETPPRMTPASDLGAPLFHEQEVVDRCRVSLDIALVGAEQLGDRLPIVAPAVAEEHVVVLRAEHPEVAPPALLLLLHQNARRIDGHIVGEKGILPHGIDDVLAQLMALPHPVTQRGTGQIEPFSREDLLLAMERKVIAEFVHHHAGQQTGARQALLDRLGWRRGNDDPCLVPGRAPLASILAANHLEPYKGSAPSTRWSHSSLRRS